MAIADTAETEHEQNLFITVSGTPGSGVTTLCRGLADALGCGYVSGGELFREIAEERGLSLSQLTARAGESEELDRALDRRLRTIAETWGTANKGFILESRLAGWLAGNRADLRIWLDAPEEVRLERTEDRDEMAAEMQVREAVDAARYESYYDIDIEDRSIYDLALNSARWGESALLSLVLNAVREYDPVSDEGEFVVPEFEP
ncbi:AAA family ATPase [Halosegnis rubeus]|jgi:cytidylate kinase|uniref:Cytidylate kinase n=1 Tax=Halosegnis rubeus TaxID=2212850 RepID=A0A5N5UD11_9EURY|nr:AAA family ATPase [Halosegnis rubeus]KAB7513026.1 AAA family ATPase [Halosegnis rubeus]KAB7513116.1 AAA family ATPase [Halosegnis rubeus]KAB7516606.1 AAA family ATPase [Halosegnis rubeus]